MIPKLKSHPITKWLNKNGWSYHKHQIETLEEATNCLLYTSPSPRDP